LGGGGWDYHNLPVEPADAAELVADHVLDRLGPKEAHQAILHWVTRLARGGTIRVVATDFDTVARAYLRGDIDLGGVNGILGPSHHSVEALSGVLRSVGLSVLTARTEGNAAVVVARRP
jgi:predicted SAM-dependent methyltransferase